AMLRRIAGDADPDQPAAAALADPDADALEEDMPRSIETMTILSQLPLFGELTTRQLAELADVVRWEVVSGGTTIVAQDEPGSTMYIVESGSVRVEVDGAGDSRRVLGELGRGELFGEMALFEDDLRSATVVATTRTRLGRIERADFEELVEEVPGIALAVCRVLSRRVRDLNRAAR
ncbi:MAG TPA: cyclic nucleotide-binding domain-containing protein, partial [Kofleriaceae bacterium]|nr:cyclic nucleotide-binding domain-containing protein [Kofleriaceae bacterium]